jgi:hypothetical protein
MKDLRLILRGGLGNQILLLAAGNFFAQRFGRRLIVNVEWFKSRQRSRSLSRFRRNIEITKLLWNNPSPFIQEELGFTSFFWYYTSFICRGLRLLLHFRIPFNTVHVDIGYLDPQLRPDKAALKAPYATYIGYYHHLEYLEPSRNWLKMMISSSGRTRLSDRLHSDFAYCGPIETLYMLHIRREDSTVKGNNHYGILSIEYYTHIIDTCNIPKNDIVVFSDDYEWASRLLFFSESMVVNEPCAVETFFLMTQFHRYMIANSTLSWCAAWLSSCYRPEVHYPNPFFESVDPYFVPSMIPDWWLPHQSFFL